MSKQSASVAELEALHKAVAKSLSTRIEQDMADNLPTDAATLGAAIKFLKDNNVSADPASSEDLTKLRTQLTAAAEARKQRASNVVDLASRDLKVMGG